jgi:hypothetical protein
MRAGWVNSGHASKFNRAELLARARKHIFVSGAGARAARFNDPGATSGRSGCDAAAPEPAARPKSFARHSAWNFHSVRAFSWQSKIEEEATMGRGLLLWLIGIPIPIILLIWLFGGLHG